VLAPALAAALGGGATLAPTDPAALGAVDAAGVLHAAMSAGMLTSPAAPAIPFRMVRRVSAFSRIGSAMVRIPPPTLPDKIRQDQPNCHPSDVRVSRTFEHY
jgi:hypothetical protein